MSNSLILLKLRLVIGLCKLKTMKKPPAAALSPPPTKKASRYRGRLLLPDKGSNLDIQIQNLSYYHYTIGQWDGKDKNLKLIEQARNTIIKPLITYIN
jgi:hypothetical protein